MRFGLKDLLEAAGVQPPSDTIRVELEGTDAARYRKVKMIIEDDEHAPIEEAWILQNALKLYERYILAKYKENGSCFKLFQAQKLGKVPVMDFPSHRDGSSRISFQATLPPQSLDRIDEMASLGGLKTRSAVVLHALNFYTQAVLDHHYGWVTFINTPDGPGDGEPVFDDKVTKLSDFRGVTSLLDFKVA